MEREIIVIIAEDDDGHAALIQRNLKRGGIINDTIRFKDGEKLLDYLFNNSASIQHKSDISYLLLLDLRMPKIDGIEVLGQIRRNAVFCNMLVIMLTTTDDPIEVNKCYSLGCNNYIVKPINYEKFVAVIQQLGIFIRMVQIPVLIEES
jgi:DNA-binding response OmpR family regulator